MIRVNLQRVYELADVFRSVGIGVVKAFEDSDPQLYAVKRVVSCCGIYAYALCVSNALVSYRLPIPGEVFWERFSDYVCRRCSEVRGFEDAIAIVTEFTKEFNKVLASQKIARLSKLCRCRDLLESIQHLDLELFRSSIAKCLDVDRDSKTVVFATKILYYVHRASNKSVEVPHTIPVALDRRVARVTYLSGAVDAESDEEVVRSRRTVISIWSTVGREANIPPLNIDSVLWRLGRYTESKTRREAYEKAEKELPKEISRDVLRKLIDNLFYRLPPQ